VVQFFESEGIIKDATGVRTVQVEAGRREFVKT